MIVMTDENAVTTIYDKHEQAESAVKQIEKGGFDMKRLTPDRAKSLVNSGAFLARALAHDQAETDPRQENVV
jgi:multidrug resistance efflux pump